MEPPWKSKKRRENRKSHEKICFSFLQQQNVVFSHCIRSNLSIWAVCKEKFVVKISLLCISREFRVMLKLFLVFFSCSMEACGNRVFRIVNIPRVENCHRSAFLTTSVEIVVFSRFNGSKLYTLHHERMSVKKGNGRQLKKKFYGIVENEISYCNWLLNILSNFSFFSNSMNLIPTFKTTEKFTLWAMCQWVRSEHGRKKLFYDENFLKWCSILNSFPHRLDLPCFYSMLLLEMETFDFVIS